MKHFDVIVVGAGHAGTEAAHAAARCGVSVALITMSKADIGVMSCNPAIGGLGKGHLVREIDAMDGIMPRVADYAGIQFRLLNRRKGPAVQGPRAQADRARYKTAMLVEISAKQNIEIIEAEVADLILSSDEIQGVVLADGSQVKGSRTILTTGTFLRGIIHIGDQRYSAGRMGDKASNKLAEKIEGAGVNFGRLKTGTPPRLDGRTINWDILEMQQGDDSPVMFSFLNSKPEARQIACGITHTNQQTHDIIQKNLSRSAMYGGKIDSLGPRYCPSIEDKVVRFADKTSHQVFLEPEGLNDHTVYPNGISTSMPADVQDAYVKSIVGLESAIILQPGYAIEYDFVDPMNLTHGLKLRSYEGLFLAGQINGTTGYEEASAQGMVAALNAVAEIREIEPPRLDRTNSYIGVMIDDLVSKGVTEPYRMFTSRAEYRLSLRADNADQRLTKIGYDFGCVGSKRWASFSTKVSLLENAHSKLSSLSISPNQAQSQGINIGSDGRRRSGQELLSFSDVDFDILARFDESIAKIDDEIKIQVQNDCTYFQYEKRQAAEIKAIQADHGVKIPANLVFENVPGLSAEMINKLNHRKPDTLGNMAMIEGVTPAALTAVLLAIRKFDNIAAASQ